MSDTMDCPLFLMVARPSDFKIIDKNKKVQEKQIVFLGLFIKFEKYGLNYWSPKANSGDSQKDVFP